MPASPQQVSPELRQWIVAQASAGHAPQTLLAAMRDSGWDEDVAVVAVEQTLQAHLAERQAGLQREAALAPPAVVALPEPALADGRSALWAGDREVKVLSTMARPRVVVFGGLASDDECDALMALARPRLERSQTVDTATGGSEVNASRTSQGMFFQRGEHAVVARLEARIAALLNWPLDNGEGLQILRYGPGAEYRPHHDYFDPAHAGTPSILKRGGQRVGTLVLYLNAPLRGGATTFPDVGIEVAPVRGNAVFFSYDRPHPDTRTLHGGAPVLEGEKWVATKWLRERRFD